MLARWIEIGVVKFPSSSAGGGRWKPAGIVRRPWLDSSDQQQDQPNQQHCA
jgi:hypothetical protein